MIPETAPSLSVSPMWTSPSPSSISAFLAHHEAPDVRTAGFFDELLHENVCVESSKRLDHTYLMASSFACLREALRRVEIAISGQDSDFEGSRGELDAAFWASVRFCSHDFSFIRCDSVMPRSGRERHSRQSTCGFVDVDSIVSPPLGILRARLFNKL